MLVSLSPSISLTFTLVIAPGVETSILSMKRPGSNRQTTAKKKQKTRNRQPVTQQFCDVTTIQGAGGDYVQTVKDGGGKEQHSLVPARGSRGGLTRSRVCQIE